MKAMIPELVHEELLAEPCAHIIKICADLQDSSLLHERMSWLKDTH